MDSYAIYKDIANRTQGDIYIGYSVIIVTTVENLEFMRG